MTVIPTDSEDKPEGAYRLVYEETVRALDRQSLQFDELRTRANLLLSAAVVAMSFLAPASLALPERLTWAAWLALALFALLGGLLVLGVLRPRRKRWHFGPEPAELLASLEDDPNVFASGLYAHIADRGSCWLDLNDKRLNTMYRCYGIAGALLLVVIVTWIVDLLIRR